jgi:hypothetical protein
MFKATHSQASSVVAIESIKNNTLIHLSGTNFGRVPQSFTIPTLYFDAAVRAIKEKDKKIASKLVYIDLSDLHTFYSVFTGYDRHLVRVIFQAAEIKASEHKLEALITDEQEK